MDGWLILKPKTSIIDYFSKFQIMCDSHNMYQTFFHFLEIDFVICVSFDFYWFVSSIEIEA